jgi:hypothetical protein
MAYQDPVPGSPREGDSAGGSAGSTTEVAKEQAGRVGQKVTDAGGQVAQATKEQAQNVVGEAKQQARDLVGEARTQVRDQAGAQRDRAVLGLRSLGDELDQMARQGGQSGIATEVARQLSTRTRDLASHLERREPSDLLEQLRSYARRRPVVFLAGAALAGVVAGRLTRSLAAGAPDDGSRALPTGYDDGYRTAQPLAVEPAPYAAPDYPGTGYEAGTGYQTPAYGTAGYPAAGDYGTAGGGFREPDAGVPDSAYGTGEEPGYPPAAYPPPAAPYEPVPEPEQPPARGWNP